MNYPKQVRCIRSVSDFYTVGKIYKVEEDGYVRDNNDRTSTNINCTDSLTQGDRTFPYNSDFEVVKD
jgi:hypothetical protein